VEEQELDDIEWIIGGVNANAVTAEREQKRAIEEAKRRGGAGS
jgi:hypothetical protein